MSQIEATNTGSTAAPAVAEPTSLPTLINRIAVDIEKALGAGDVADLRRLRPQDVGRPAFWRMVASRLEPAGALPAGGAALDEAERRWAVLLAGMAEMQGLHRPGVRLGRALFEANVAELRLVRLLRAHDDALADAVRVTVHQLTHAAQPVDRTDLAWLVLSDSLSNEESVRRRIARDYYGAAYRAQKETNQ